MKDDYYSSMDQSNWRPRRFARMPDHPLTSRICVIILLLALNVAELTKADHDRRSGLYADNGRDRTMILGLSTEEKLELEHEILKLLGFPEKPVSTNGTRPIIKRSAPKFLLGVYENVADDDVDQRLNRSEKSTGFHLTGQDLRMIDQSDVIITFAAHQNHQGAGGKPDRVKRTWFDVDRIPADIRMISAELRLYRAPTDAKNRMYRGGFTISVFRVLRTKDGERELHLVDSTNTTAGQEGWITLNVTESLQHWINHPGDNKGFYLSVHPIDRESRETRPENIGIVGFRGDAELQPFMAGFFESAEPDRPRLIQPTLRSINEFNRRNQKRYTSDIRELLKDRYETEAGQYSAKPCKIENLHVSFKDLQWQDWIIAPEGFDAFYCKGECKFPLNTHMNATNHAIVQTLVHLMHPQKVPKPCCAPTKLSEISVIYFLDENNVIFKKYNNMVVRGCGCH